jgi:hypothetical protein
MLAPAPLGALLPPQLHAAASRPIADADMMRKLPILASTIEVTESLGRRRLLW